MSATNTEDPPQLGVYKCKEMIHDIFLQTGHKDILMAHIRHKTTQQGWTWTMRDEFMNYIKKRGTDNVNVSHMVADLAPKGRETFPADLKKEMVDIMFEVTKDYFTIDDSITPITDPDNANSEAEKTFLYQSRDVKADPGIGIGVELQPDSPPPSPQSSASTSSTPRQSPGPVPSSTSNTSRQSPVQSAPRQSPGAVPRHSPISTAPRLTPPQTLPPPPVLRPETVSAAKSESVARSISNEEEEPEEEDDDEDARNNEEDEEDELMDV